MTRRHIPDHIRRTAVADYYAGTQAAAQVGARYDIPRSTFAAWVAHRKEKDEIALTNGRWVGGLVKRWDPFIKPRQHPMTEQELRVEWEESMFTVEEAREAHRRFAGGCREPRTVVGERVYQRRSKRGQRERRTAA